MRWILWLALLAALAAAAAGGYWFGHRSAGAAPHEEAGAEGQEEKPVASVGVVPLRRGKISKQVVAYGTVVAPPGEVRIVSVPFESHITRILVSAGQTVTSGQPLIEVEGSAATALALEEARNSVDAGQRDLQLVQERYQQKLATNTELFAAQNTLRSAEARLKSLQQGGAGRPRELKSDVGGLVSKLDVQQGQVVAIGGPLIEIAARARIEVKLGVEPNDARLLKVGEASELRRVEDAGAAPVTGMIRLIAQRVDPMTRLVDVLVSLPADARLLLETTIAGRITLAQADALIVPRNSVLPDEQQSYSLFTVKDGKAIKHAVHIGIETDQDVQVVAEDLKEGDSVVAVGNYELEDGMAVSPQTAATQPDSTEPASTGPASSEDKP